MDDFFSWDFTNNLTWYRGAFCPRHQVQLLILWESITCPFENRKQEYGELLKIIGFWADANQGSISLPPQSVTDLVGKIDSFLATSNWTPTLCDWQCLTGHLNWLLNVLPWGHPGLTELYRKMSGKTHSFAGIPINATITADLSWLKSIIPHSIGIWFVNSSLWCSPDADLVMWTNATLKTALSFVYTNHGFIYPIHHPTGSAEKINIFFLELVAILSAIHHAASFPRPPHRLLLWTDSLDAVHVLNSLRTSEIIHNAPLLGIAEVILNSGIDLQVRHIERKLNIHADMLSCLLLDDYHSRFPADHVHYFTPPWELMPA